MKVLKTSDGAFEYGYVASAKDMVGKMENFHPHWWAQYQADGTSQIFNTKKECLEWIGEWYVD